MSTSSGNWTEADTTLIRQQLDKLLASGLFSQSDRQSRFSRCVVEEELAARYQLSGKTGLIDFLRSLRADLNGIATGDFGTIGAFLPKPDVNQKPGSVRPSWNGPSQALKQTAELHQPDQSAEMILKSISGWTSHVLNTGERLVLFLEWRGLTAADSRQDIGLTDPVLAILLSLPERVGIVISGLPDAIRQDISGEAVYEHDTETDEELEQQSEEKYETDDNAEEQAPKARLTASAQAAKTESMRLLTEAIQFEPDEYAAISASCSAVAALCNALNGTSLNVTLRCSV